MFKIIGADGKEYGPVDAAQLRAWIKEGRVDGKTLASAEATGEWKPLAAFPEFSSAIPTPPPVAASPGYAPQTSRVNGFAVTGMILGILSLTLCFCCCGLPCNLLGFIFSLIALSQIKQNPQLYTGRGMAITGLVLCIASFVLAICWLLAGGLSDWDRFNHFQREFNRF